MTTKELLKKEIDELSEEQAKKAYKLLKEAKKDAKVKEKNQKRYISNKRNFNLSAVDFGGYFDDKDIRKLAYE